VAPTAKLLLVDRSGDALLSLRRVLGRRGYQVRCVRTRGDALRLLTAEPFDLVVTDWLLADGEARQVAADAKDNIPRCRVLVLTEYERGWCVPQSNDPNVDAYLPKPYDPSELLAHVDRLVRLAGPG
jgi:DNA-binding response OmpR family regulator